MKQQLKSALEAMKLLEEFDPRLAGLLAQGVSDLQSPIILHVNADDPDTVRHQLEDRGIPTRTVATRMHIPRGPSQSIPGLAFLAGEQEFRIWIFNDASFRQRVRVGDEVAPSARLKRKVVEQRFSEASKLEEP